MPLMRCMFGSLEYQTLLKVGKQSKAELLKLLKDLLEDVARTSILMPKEFIQRFCKMALMLALIQSYQDILMEMELLMSWPAFSSVKEFMIRFVSMLLVAQKFFMVMPFNS